MKTSLKPDEPELLGGVVLNARTLILVAALDLGGATGGGVVSAATGTIPADVVETLNDTRTMVEGMRQSISNLHDSLIKLDAQRENQRDVIQRNVSMLADHEARIRHLENPKR